MLIDEVAIHIQAGHGGKGAVAFNKNLMSLGPAGGSGGKGGSVWAQAVSDLGALSQFRHKKSVTAENGRDGRGQFCDGHDGKDIVIKVPVGTVFKWNDGNVKELTKTGEKLLLAKGGRGGKGNFLFRSSRNTTPTEHEMGQPGENLEIVLELKMIADVGLIGLPNVGKSSLLNALTAASAKVGNYRFTTLEPNLGVYYGLILADIPGLIEGAAAGKGLGHKFLRHIERTRVILHLLAADSENPLVDYQLTRTELAAYKQELLEKEEYVIISKSDCIDKQKLDSLANGVQKIGKKAHIISIYDQDSMQEIKKLLNKISQELKN